MRKLSYFVLALALSASGCKSRADRTCERYFEIAYLEKHKAQVTTICDQQTKDNAYNYSSQDMARGSEMDARMYRHYLKHKK